MTLNAEVFEAAESAFAPQLSDDMKAHLHRAIERAIAVADLVERSELKLLLNKPDREVLQLAKERDKARCQTQEMIEERNHLLGELTEARLKSNEYKDEAETRGRQLAALRTVLDDAVKAFDSGALRMTSNKVGSQSPCAPPQHPWHEEWLHHAREALTDTAEAAAQWVRVDDEHVVVPVEPTDEMLKPYDGTGIIPPRNTRVLAEGFWREMLAAAPNLSSVALAEGEAGEPEGEDER